MRATSTNTFRCTAPSTIEVVPKVGAAFFDEVAREALRNYREADV